VTSIHTIEYYIAREKNKPLLYTSMWMNNIYHEISFVESSRAGKMNPCLFKSEPWLPVGRGRMESPGGMSGGTNIILLLDLGDNRKVKKKKR
jgi:hypothetical protein